jgi:hypothetical protein
MADAVDNLFGLLALLGDRRSVRDAHRSIISRHPGIIGNAVEYLDNTLPPSVKRFALAVVEDHPIEERLHTGRTLFSIAGGSRLEVLDQLVNESFAEDGDGSGWGAAALYEVYASRTDRLYAAVDRVRRSDRAAPLSRETAEWIARRIDIPVAAAGRES